MAENNDYQRREDARRNADQREKIYDRLRAAEETIARIEEQTKTIFIWMEQHSDEEKEHHASRERAFDKLTKEICGLAKSQQELIAMKNKWAGIFLALTFMGGIALAVSGLALNWARAFFTG